MSVSIKEGCCCCCHNAKKPEVQTFGMKKNLNSGIIKHGDSETIRQQAVTIITDDIFNVAMANAKEMECPFFVPKHQECLLPSILDKLSSLNLQFTQEKNYYCVDEKEFIKLRISWYK